MTDRDKKLLIAAVALIIVGACWMLVLGPKRSAVSTAKQERADAAAALATAKETATKGTEQKKHYRVGYINLLNLGKAIPVDDDSAGLIVQMNDMAKHADVDFVNLTVQSGTTAQTAGSTGPVGPSTATTCADDTASTAGTGATPLQTGATGSNGLIRAGQHAEDAQQNGSNDANRAAGSNAGSSTDTANCTDAPTLTDVTAASLGLEVDTFNLTFDGKFFDLHKFLQRIYDLVEVHNGTTKKVSATGRLFSISSINLTNKTFPVLEAQVAMTGYLLPPGSSATAGATPSGPAPAATPAAATTGGSTPPPEALIGGH